MPRRTPTKRVTSADVAREAGVSRATVSFVLNETPGQTIPEATRRRVLEAARTLRYQPSAAARTLRSGRSEIVLFLMPNWSTSEVVAKSMDAMSAAFSERGMAFLVHPRATSNRHLSDLWRSITPALVITVGELDPHERATLDIAGVAHLGLDIGDTGQALGAHQLAIGRSQAEHLVRLGHTRLGYATTSDASLSVFAEPRLLGAQQVCAEHGLPAPLSLSAEPGAQAAQSLRAWRSAGVTAIAAYNDDVALALLQAARASEITVPDDLSVIGADDITAAELAFPPLTTIRSDPSALAPALVAMVLARLDGRPSDHLPHLPGGELILRDSTRTRAE